MFKRLTADDSIVAARVALVGEPNTLKTTSVIKTWDRPLGIVSSPGEKGWETIPRNDPGIISYIWQIDDPEKANPHAIVKEVEKTTFEMLAGKYGSIASFCFDGGHKLYQWYYKRALADRLLHPPSGWDGDEDKMRGPAYGTAHLDYGLFLTRVLASSVPYIVMTFWESLKKDNVDDLRKRAPKHIFADLPGEMGKNIVGEFSAVLYAKVSKPDPKGNVQGLWLTRAAGEVWGVGIKVPPDIAKNIPERIPQDFQILRALMKGEQVAPERLKVPPID